MRDLMHRGVLRSYALTMGALWLGLTVTARAADSMPSSLALENRLWREGVELAGNGDFSRARDVFGRITVREEVADKVRAWLDEYEGKQAERLKLNREDFDKYVGYAKARIERKEFRKALTWILVSGNCAENEAKFLAEPWVQSLVNDALVKAEKSREDQDWSEAYGVYWRLADLFPSEPRYEKLVREVVTHLRYENMFKEDSEWLERLDRIRWEDAKRALEYVGMYYVEPADFKAITERALEQLLLLAESSRAQATLEGLGREDDRNEFMVRVRKRLEQVRAAPEVDRRDCVAHLRRVVKKINPSTIEMPEELLVSEMMRGALDPLDEFTTIIWPKEAADFDKHTRGDFIGVGIQIVKNKKDEVEVSTPLEDTPAFRAGIQSGDVITHVDGKSIAGFSLNKVVDTITGPKDTDVTLTIRRDDESIEFPLRRAKVKIQSVKGWTRDREHGDGDEWDYWLDRDSGIAYIRVTNFQRNTVEDVTNVLSELEAKNLRGLVLDLRWNPGGLLDSAYNMSRLFLREGDTVVSTKGRGPNENQQFDVRGGDGPYKDLPLTVLVNGSSASASEIVSGAIRDNHRGLVVGERTFGKFSVQNLITLGRTKAKLKVTTARYYLPSGVSLHREPGSQTWGVEPDIHTSLVRWERFNAYQMRREQDLIGPAKPEKKDDEKDEDDQLASAHSPNADDKDGNKEDAGEGGPTDNGDAADKPTDEEASDKPADEKAADATKKDDELPELKQPDENNRPMADPQIDAALLLMRMQLIAQTHPTLAVAEMPAEKNEASP